MDDLQIIVLEDDDSYRSSLSSFLKEAGCSVLDTKTSDKIFDPVHSQESTIYLANFGTDINLAVEFFGDMKRRHQGPVLVLVDGDDHVDRIVFLELGADDCILKTAHAREILARIRVAHRLSRPAQRTVGPSKPARPDESLVGWQVLPETRGLIAPDGHRIELTPHQFRLLDILMEHTGNAMSRDDLFRKMFNRPPKADDRSIDNLIVRLRRKLGESARAPGMIKTARAGGYFFNGFPGIAVAGVTTLSPAGDGSAQLSPDPVELNVPVARPHESRPNRTLDIEELRAASEREIDLITNNISRIMASTARVKANVRTLIATAAEGCRLVNESKVRRTFHEADSPPSAGA